jgi:hypothetical protein
MSVSRQPSAMSDPLKGLAIEAGRRDSMGDVEA